MLELRGAHRSALPAGGLEALQTQIAQSGADTSTTITTTTTAAAAAAAHTPPRRAKLRKRETERQRHKDTQTHSPAHEGAGTAAGHLD